MLMPVSDTLPANASRASTATTATLSKRSPLHPTTGGTPKVNPQSQALRQTATEIRRAQDKQGPGGLAPPVSPSTTKSSLAPEQVPPAPSAAGKRGTRQNPSWKQAAKLGLLLLPFAGPALTRGASVNPPSSSAPSGHHPEPMPSLALGLPDRMHADLEAMHSPSERSQEEIRTAIVDEQGVLVADKLAELITTASPQRLFAALNSLSWCGDGRSAALEKCVHDLYGGELWLAARHNFHFMHTPNVQQINDLNIARLAFEQLFGPYVDRSQPMPIVGAATMHGQVGRTLPTTMKVGATNYPVVMLNDRLPSGQGATKQTAMHELLHAHASPALGSALSKLKDVAPEEVDEALTEFLSTAKWTQDTGNSAYEDLDRRGVKPFSGSPYMSSHEFGTEVAHVTAALAQSRSKDTTARDTASEADTALQLGLHVMAQAYLSGDREAIQAIQEAILTVKHRLEAEHGEILLNEGNLQKLAIFTCIALGAVLMRHEPPTPSVEKRVADLSPAALKVLLLSAHSKTHIDPSDGRVVKELERSRLIDGAGRADANALQVMVSRAAETMSESDIHTLPKDLRKRVRTARARGSAAS